MPAAKEERKFKLVPVKNKGYCYLDDYGVETIGINFHMKPIAEATNRTKTAVKKGILWQFKFHGKIDTGFKKNVLSISLQPREQLSKFSFQKIVFLLSKNWKLILTVSLTSQSTSPCPRRGSPPGPPTSRPSSRPLSTTPATGK